MVARWEMVTPTSAMIMSRENRKRAALSSPVMELSVSARVGTLYTKLYSSCG